MEQLLKFVKTWKYYILRALVGAALAVILGYIAGIHVWLVGAIIAVGSELVVARVNKPFNEAIKKAEIKIQERNVKKSDVTDAEILDEQVETSDDKK